MTDGIVLHFLYSDIDVNADDKKYIVMMMMVLLTA